MDRRKQRTREYLRDALLELVLEKGYDAITVQEITDRAKLGRATFYLHFKDKEELLLTSLKATVDELTARIQQDFTLKHVADGSVPPSLIAFQHAAENKNLYRVMLNSQIAGSVLSQIRNMIAAHIETQLRSILPAVDLPAPLEVLGQHIAGSLMGLVAWWLERDAPYSPEEMAQMVNKLTAQPLMLLAMREKIQ